MKHYTTKDGLPSNTIFMCHQDINGYIWFIGHNGLTKFDGKKFRKQTKGNYRVLADIATSDYNNNIWALNTSYAFFSVINGNSISKYKDSNISVLPFKGGKLGEQIYAHKSQTAYMIGPWSLISIKKNHKPAYKRIKLDRVVSIFETIGGEVFTFNGKDIFTVKDTSVSLFQHLQLNKIYTSLTYRNDTIFISSKNTIRKYLYASGKFALINTISLKKEIYRVHADQYGLWVAYRNSQSACLFANYTFTSDPIEIKLPGLVNRFLTDREGGVWINTFDNGLIYIPNPSVINYTKDDGLQSQTIYAIEPINKHQFWVGYNSGVIDKVTIRNHKIFIEKRITLTDNLPGYNYLIDIIHKKDKTYFLSRGNLSLLQKQKINTLFSNGSAYKSIMVINDSIMSIGSTNQIFYNTKTRKKRVFNTGRVYTQVIDSQKKLWLGSSETGLFYLQPNQDTLLKSVAAFKNTPINTLAIYKTYMWVISLNRGVFLLKGDSIIKQFSYNNLFIPSHFIPTVLIDKTNLWLGTSKGLVYYNIDYNTLKANSPILINRNDGLISEDIVSIKKSNNDFLIATNDGGIAILNNTNKQVLNYTVSDITFKNLQNNEILAGDSIQVEYSKKGLEIEFHTAALKYHDEISYRYKFEPFHNEWRTTTNNIIQYTNVPPGDYKFLIEVRDRRPNTTSTLSTRYIRIQPLIWQTAAFKVITLLIIVLIIALVFYWFYRYQIAKTNKKLEQERVIAKTKLETLKAQIKPHFIFNSLNGIKDYVYGNKEEDIANLLQKLSGLIRKGLYLSDNDYVLIEDEILFLETYLDLEKVKCENCFDYKINVQENLKEISIPSLITQPFVENAVVHGIHLSNSKRPYIRISYTSIGNDIECRIMDNGIGITKSLERKKIDSSKGIEISMKRINYIKIGLDIDVSIHVQDRHDISTKENGTLVVITIKDILKEPLHVNKSINTR